MPDTNMKDLTANLECPTFETTAFVAPPPLADATVAIVTSASLHHPDDSEFAPQDTSFRFLDSARRDYRISHWSQNFDATAYGLDYNVVFPIDRLDELATSGRIGRVADQHMAYAGNQFDLTGVRMDSGPEGAKLLKEQGVDVVLLTPV